jgi:predicted DNA-binding WGR domain protein
MKAHLELVDGRSSKFWEVAVAGKTMTVRFGRIGSDGQTKRKTMTSPAAAEGAARKLLSEKLAKGYRRKAAARAKAKAKASGATASLRAANKRTATRPDAKRAAAKNSPRGGGAIEKLVITLDRLTRQYLIGEGENPDDPKVYELFAAPSRKDLAAHLEAWPDLPPSYVEFLSRHAGWKGFWGDCSLLGPRNAKNDKQWARTLRGVRGMDGYLDDDDDPADPDFIRATDCIPIAFHENYSVLGFDRRKPGKNGELQVVDLMRANGCVDNRHKNFATFLDNQIACTRRWIADQES